MKAHFSASIPEWRTKWNEYNGIYAKEPAAMEGEMMEGQMMMEGEMMEAAAMD